MFAHAFFPAAFFAPVYYPPTGSIPPPPVTGPDLDGKEGMRMLRAAERRKRRQLRDQADITYAINAIKHLL
jgi:hypothetical protein